VSSNFKVVVSLHFVKGIFAAVEQLAEIPFFASWGLADE
jgi:hypothetical protein